ncbi:MAG: TM2 domain-containing protein [Micropruina sp.]|uniref:TM2 domain-containing protein n=1 Tax=Micropruina sp. TaxID=2737536 RepID=UPI0039E2A735
MSEPPFNPSPYENPGGSPVPPQPPTYTPYPQQSTPSYPGYAQGGYPPQPSPYGAQLSPYQAQGNPYAPQPLAPFGVDPMTGLPYSDKSKLVAGLLQIFLGGLGIGRFYLGNAGIAILQIIVTFITFGFGALWPLIDGIVLLAGHPRDRAGRPLRP